MAKLNLTAKLLASQIKLSVSSRKPVTLYDTEVRGLLARISPTGRVTWAASKSLGRGSGSNQTVVVGHYPGMSLEAARIEAGLAIARLAKGDDVASQVKARKRAKVESRQCSTLSDTVVSYLSERRGDPDSDYEKRVKDNLESARDELGASTRINAVTKADIRALLKTRKDAGHFEAARWMFSQLRPFFDWCVHEELISISPCAGVKPPDVGSARQHKLNDHEIKTLILASYAFKEADESVPIQKRERDSGPFWRLLLMLAQRRGELAGMRWREIDLAKAEWIIPGSRTKNKREHLVPLPRQAVTELRELGPRVGEADYVFGKYPTAPFSGFSKAKRELDAAMTKQTNEVLRPWRIHDLRRTGASGMKALKVQPHIIEAVLNHTAPRLQATYQVWDVHEYADEKRESLQVWADYLSSLAIIDSLDTGNVIYLKA